MANSLSGLDAVLPDGDDLTRWRTGLTTVATTWTAIETRVAADVDWPSLELDLQAAGRAQADLIAARDRLLAGAVAALGRLDLSGLGAVAAAMRAVPEVPEVRLTPILDGFVAQLRSLRDGLEHWELGPDDVRAVVRGLVQRLRDAIDNSPIGEIRRWLLAFEQRVLAMVDSLPLRAVADEITGTLDAVAAAVDGVDLDGLLAPVTHLGETVGAAISGLGGDAVRNTIGQVWDAVDTALNQAATVLGQLRDALDAVTGPLGEFTSARRPGGDGDHRSDHRGARGRRRLRPRPAGRRGRRHPPPRPRRRSRRSTCRCCRRTRCASSATPPTRWPTSTSRPRSTVRSPRCSTRSTPDRRSTPPPTCSPRWPPSSPPSTPPS